MTAQNNAQANLTGLSRTGLERFSWAILHGSCTYQTRLNWTELFKLNSLVSISADLGEFARRPGAERIGIEGIPCFVFLFALPVSLSVIPTTPFYFAADEQRCRADKGCCPHRFRSSLGSCTDRKREGEFFFSFSDFFLSPPPPTQREPLMRGITRAVLIIVLPKIFQCALFFFSKSCPNTLI